MEKCGPFTLVGQLGSGSLTEVWRAVRITEGRGGPNYALKRVLQQLDPEVEFTTGIRTLGTAATVLSHPSIVRTFEAGTETPKEMTTLGRTYVAQELVVGKPLNALLNQIRTQSRDIPRPLTFTVLGHVLTALSAAHRATGPGGAPLHIVHGDVAPANVFVTTEGGVKLGDFCINRARTVLRHGTNAPLRARFHYLAPETARTGAIDVRSDLYAVGVILHELLASRRLRRGNTPDELLQQAQSGVWPPLESLGIATDAELNTIVTRSIHDDPNQRYQSADEFLGALGAYATRQNLVMSPQMLAALMNQHFPALPAQEAEGRQQANAVFDALEGANAAAPMGVQPRAPDPEPEVPAEAPPARPRPARSPMSTSTRVVAGVAVLAVVGAAGLAMRSVVDRTQESQSSVETGPKRDLSRLVGGRTVLAWKQQISAIDKALASTSDLAEQARLKALREDTVRKGQALGLKELQ